MMREWIFPVASGLTAFLVTRKYLPQMQDRFGYWLTILMVGAGVSLVYSVLAVIFNT